MADVELVVYDAAIQELARDSRMGDVLVEAAAPAVAEARAGAPRRTGAGGASIHAEPVLDGPEWTARATWERERFYMYFHERGTEKMPARPFLVPAFAGAQMEAVLQ